MSPQGDGSETEMLIPDSANVLIPDSVEEIMSRADSAFIDSLGVVDSITQKYFMPNDSVVGRDSVATDSLRHDSVPRAKERFVKRMVDLDNSVQFSAKDSLVFYGRNNAKMFGSSEVTYGNINLKSMQIEMNMDNSEVYAIGRPDSTGELEGIPVFKDPSGEYESKTMRYNFKSKRGYITEVVTQQGEGFLTGGQTKKMENDEYYIQSGRYTTCDNHEHPHFYLQLTKAKVRPKKDIVVGPAYMVLADVPLPLAIPFGFFPFSEEYSSGIIMPTFGDDYNRGFYLRDGGD